MGNEPVKIRDLVAKIMIVLIVMLWIAVGVIIFSAMTGCGDTGRRFGVSGGSTPVVTKFVPPYFDKYGTMIAVLDNPEASPVGWLFHGNGVFGLTSVEYMVRCPSRPPQFGAYNFSLYNERANFTSGRTIFPVGTLPDDGQTFSGPLSHSYLPPEAGVTGGWFTATFSDSDSTLRGVAHLVVNSPCNPAGSPPDSSFARPFVLVADWHRPKL